VRLQKLSLSSAPFYTSITVILSLIIFIGAFWLYNEYRAYRESIENIRENHESRYKGRLQEELGNVVDLIEYKRSQSDMMIENEIRQKVQTAYTISSHIYSLYKEEKSVDELRAMVVEILRPIRWNNGRGYYFTGRLSDGTIDLFADDPSFEGKKSLPAEDLEGRNVVDEFIRIVREKEAGIYRYNWAKRNDDGKAYPKISFVKYFKPFDWYIGAGMYIDDMEEMIQNDVLARVQKMKFGNDGKVFGFRYDGTIICNSDERRIGSSIRDLISTTGRQYGQELLHTGLEKDEGGFIGYTERRFPDDRISQRLSYVKAYRDWRWIFGTSMNMNEMEKAIDHETEIYKKIAFKNIFLFIVLCSFAVTLLLVAAYSYSLKIRHEISLFTDFFRKAADSKVKINDRDLLFSEFEELALLANRMVDDRIRKDLLLHRDELRLDTLLQLGKMEGHSIKDIYDFTLMRIVQITRSAEGYLALVNEAQSSVTICSHVRVEGDDADRHEENGALTQPLERGGFPGAAVLRKEPHICNDFSMTENSRIYPYSLEVKRHLDVPISNAGKIAIVAGVCNNQNDYDNSDIRQMQMVLEGMWLHILKVRSEKEMERLERQVIAVSQEERSQIGRDLHDDLGSHLSGVEMLSRVLQKKLETEAPEKAQQLGVIRNLIRDAIEKTRRLSQGLYPVHLIEHGMEASIEELVMEIENRFHITCTLLFDNRIVVVDNNVATHIYFIIREAVFNAARHGKPSRIDIVFKGIARKLNVQIADDGCGLDEMFNEKKGMGFHTMKYRAKAIGASLDIRPGDRGGTLVVLSGEVLQ
jgi:signal transduction histidine kinase